MMNQLEVPRVEDLADLPVEVRRADAPGVTTVTALANDGDTVAVTWDEIACSVSVRWREEVDRLVLERETASKVSVREGQGQIEFWIWSDSDGLTGELVVRVGAQVTVSDKLLRT
jgi:hypothetical protein